MYHHTQNLRRHHLTVTMATIDTTQGPLLRRSLQLATPAVLQALLVNCYAFNDFFFVGLLGDEHATAALSACFALVIVSNTLVGIFPTGAMALMAQSFGGKDLGRVAHLLRTVLSTSLIWALLLGILALWQIDAIVMATNVSGVVGERIKDYMSILFYGLMAFALMRSVTGAYYACGDTKLPLFLEFLSLIVNTALNAVLVLGLGPFEAMGIQGAAVATVISRAFPASMGLVMALRGSLGIPLVASWRAWAPTRDDVIRMGRIGVYESISGMLYGVIYLMLNRMAGEIGDAAQGGLGAGLRGIEWIGFAFGDGFAKASTAIVGQNIGAGKRRRALRGAWLNAGLSALCCQLVGMLFLFFPEQLSSIITDDVETLRFAARYIELIGWVMWAVGLEMSMYGALIGAGWTQMCVWISGMNNILRVPIAAALVFGVSSLVEGTLWAVTGAGEAPATHQDSFDGLVIAIGVTAVFKAFLYIVFFTTRKKWLSQENAPDAMNERASNT